MDLDKQLATTNSSTNAELDSASSKKPRGRPHTSTISTTEAIREYQRIYYQMHKEKAKEYQRLYNLTHKKKRGGQGKTANFIC